MHVVWPDSYGPLQDGYIEVIRTQDTRVLGLLKVLFYSSFALALWRSGLSVEFAATVVFSVVLLVILRIDWRHHLIFQNTFLSAS
jgi:hypothetical protein